MNPSLRAPRVQGSVFLSPHNFHRLALELVALCLRRGAVHESSPDGPAAEPRLLECARLVEPSRIPIHAEEGGTPANHRELRAGLGLPTKYRFASTSIRAREAHFIRRPSSHGLKTPTWNCSATGTPKRRSERVCFVVKHAGSTCTQLRSWALLIRSFGIPARAVASCAGRMVIACLACRDRSHQFERQISRGCEGINRAWVRVNFTYFHR